MGLVPLPLPSRSSPAGAQPQLNATVTTGVASLQQYALNFTEPKTNSIQQQAQDGLCPSGAELKWARLAGQGRAGTHHPGAQAPCLGAAC